MSLRLHADLRQALDRAEAAWAECAAQVDIVFACQTRAQGNE